MNRKWRIPALQARSSLSKAEYRVSAGASFFEKNPRGCQPALGEDRCCREAPSWRPEASTIRAISAACLGCARVVAAERASLAAWKAPSMEGDQSTTN
jgi:hypothetical protein